MRRYRFEVSEELITPIEVMADTEQEARERLLRQDEYVTAFDSLRGDLHVLLRSVSND